MSDTLATRRARAIPEVRENLPNHREVLMALKEGVEELQGIRGSAGLQTSAWLRGEALDWLKPRLSADVTFFHGPTPTAIEVIHGFVVLREMYFLPGLGGSAFQCAVAPTADYTFDILVNGFSVGVVLFLAGQTVGYVQPDPGGTDIRNTILELGDSIQFVGDLTPDATISGIYGGLKGFLK